MKLSDEQLLEFLVGRIKSIHEFVEREPYGNAHDRLLAIKHITSEALRQIKQAQQS